MPVYKSRRSGVDLRTLFQPSPAKVRKKPIICEGCGQDYADPPGVLCPGCEAYKDHQQ